MGTVDWTRQDGVQDVVFGVPQQDGFLALNGKMHFENGRLMRLSLERGGDWAVSGSPVGPVVVHLFSEIQGTPPAGETIDVKQVPCKVQKLYFADGKLVRAEAPVPSVVDMSQCMS